MIAHQGRDLGASPSHFSITGAPVQFTRRGLIFAARLVLILVAIVGSWLLAFGLFCAIRAVAGALWEALL